MKRTTKMLAFVLTFAMICSLLVGMTLVSATNGLQISATTASAAAGETVTVQIKIDSNPGIITLGTAVSYNPDVLTLTTVTEGSIFGSFTDNFTSNTGFVQGAYQLFADTALAAENITATGTVATLTFSISDGAAAGDYPIALSEVSGSTKNYDMVSVACTFTNGKVTVESAGGLSLDNITSKPAESVLPAENISFEGNTMTITPAANTPACVVLIKDANGNYTRVPAVKQPDDTYDFDLSELNGGEIVIALKGDVDGDGVVDATDVLFLQCGSLSPTHSSYVALSGFGSLTGDVDGDGVVDATDILCLQCSMLNTTNNNYFELTW